MMDFATLPPEINSARMYMGAGSAPLLGASAAWGTVAQALAESAIMYASTATGLAAAWTGPSAAAMTASATKHVAWLTATAEHAEHTAVAAAEAAAAYETAFTATIPPPVIAENRTQLAALIVTNLLGQNTAAIMATEAAYMEMWAQDAAAMYTYAASSSAAVGALPQFTPPSQTTNPTGTEEQNAAVMQAAQTPAGTGQNILQWLLGQLSDSGTLLGQLNEYAQAFVSSGPYEVPLSLLSLFSSLWAVSEVAGPNSPLTAGTAPGAETIVFPPEPGTPVASAPPIRADLGAGRPIGMLRTPPDWVRSPTTSTAPPVGIPLAVAENTLATPMPTPMPLGGIPRNGTPTKRERPQPEYGGVVRFIPRPPAGG